MALSKGICFFLTILFIVCCSKAPKNLSHLNSAPAMDIERIVGEWTVAARIPTYFDPEVASMNVVISKELPDKFQGRWRFSVEKDGPSKDYSFSIVPGSGKDSTKWSVKAFWFLKFDLRVLEFSGDYSWIAIGSQDRRYFWLLTTGTSSEPTLIKAILDRHFENGFSKDHILVSEKP